MRGALARPDAFAWDDCRRCVGRGVPAPSPDRGCHAPGRESAPGSSRGFTRTTRLRAKPEHHAALEGVGLALRIGPEQEMSHLMVKGLDPHPLALVDAAAFPVLGMDEVDAAVFVSLARGLAVIDVLVPFDARQLDVIVAAEIRDGATKRDRTMSPKKFGKFAVNFPSKSYRGNYHSHGLK